MKPKRSFEQGSRRADKKAGWKARADIILNMKKKGYSVALIADATDKKPGRLAPVRFFVTYYEALF